MNNITKAVEVAMDVTSDEISHTVSYATILSAKDIGKGGDLFYTIELRKTLNEYFDVTGENPQNYKDKVVQINKSKVDKDIESDSKYEIYNSEVELLNR